MEPLLPNSVSSNGLRTTFSFDSYMVPTEDLRLGDKRLLEATQRVQMPVHSMVQTLITSDDVIHS